MFELTRMAVNKLADSANFNRNTTEKVLRLYSVLRFFSDTGLWQCLALKGGTAINLFLLDLPRLSVDIDLDFDLPVGRDEMLKRRQHIDKEIMAFMPQTLFLGLNVNDLTCHPMGVWKTK